MPYKDKNKDKARLKKYYLENKQLVKDRGKKWYDENKDTVKAQHKEKRDELLKKNKEWRINNKDKIKSYKHKNRKQRTIQSRKDRKKSIDNLKDAYVVHNIHLRTSLSKIEIRKHPELIESYRQQIKTKRLIKSKKHGIRKGNKIAKIIKNT